MQNAIEASGGVAVLAQGASPAGLSRIWNLINCHEMILSEPKLSVTTPTNALAFNQVIQNSIDLAWVGKDEAVDHYYDASVAEVQADQPESRDLAEMAEFRREYLDTTRS